MDSGRLEAVPPGAVHLDTVRALHQTVVSLRTALEVSKNELKELKEKYEQHSRCIEYSDLIEKLTLENHILRRKIIDSGFDEKDQNVPNIKLEITCSPRENVEESEVIICTATTEPHSAITANIELEEKPEQLTEHSFCSVDKLNEIKEVQLQSPEINAIEISPEHQVSSATQGSEKPELEQEEIDADQEKSQFTTCRKSSEDIPASFKTKLELLSKFDVRIKVQTLKEGVTTSSTTSDSDSTIEEKRGNEPTDSKSFQFEEKRTHFENAEDNRGNKIRFKAVSSENVKMAVPNEAEAKSKVDKFDVQVRITSEENLVVKEKAERSRRKDTLNLDVDDLSLRSLSEGDNSVFSEGGQTPIDPNTIPQDDKDQDNGSGNESEEVDDIELIFTTDESKDMSNLQEDLVSIREGEPWVPTSASTHSTPVLIKFHTLDPDFQPGGDHYNENVENSKAVTDSPRMKRVSLPSDSDIRNVPFNGRSLDMPGRGILKSYDNKSDNMLYRKSPSASARKLDSVDSLVCEYNRGMSFDTTKSSSFEMGSSMEILQREESMDSFHRTSHLGHRFSVFAEPDISKCGISEEDLGVNLNVRRNTCPNPFQYRPSAYRGVSRAPGPFKAGGMAGRVRPVLRDGSGPRRETGAQTDVSALPPRWGSDGYLAYKMAPPTVPTLPGRSSGAAAAARRLTVPDARPPPLMRRTDETRRVLLSDIGFTSMVPELSRSADPVWALAKKAHNDAEPTTTTSTSKFVSRGSSYRSPCVSLDRSWMDGEWVRNLQLPMHKRDKFDVPISRYSMPDVRCPLLDYETDLLMKEADTMLRTSLDDLHDPPFHLDTIQPMGKPYVPLEPRHLKLGHYVKVITPNGRIALGRVRYVGYAGATAAHSSVMIGAEFPVAQNPGLARNDGIYAGRRYFLAPLQYNALFVPFSKVVMAWQ